MRENPFLPPKSNVHDLSNDKISITKLSIKEVKQLKNLSNNIRSIGSFWLIGAILAIAFSVFKSQKANDATLYILMAIYCLLFVYICYLRPFWGRHAGIAYSTLSLAIFPLGTILGAIGLYSIYRGKLLFGKDRIKHCDIIKEFKRRHETLNQK